MRGPGLIRALTFVLAACTVASAQNNQLRGKVRTTNGSTVNNAIVELRVAGAMITQTVTRNDGDFAFSNLARGEYEVTVMMTGYDTAGDVVRFDTGMRDSPMQIINIEVFIVPKVEFFLAAPSTTFAQDVPRSARAAYEKGRGKLREGKHEACVALFREAIGIFDDYFDAHFALGKEFYREGKDGEALESLDRARQINDREGAVYHVFGLVMVRQQKFGVAEYAFREASRLNPGSAASHFYHAVALIEVAVRTSDEKQRLLDLDEAEKELNRSWELSDKRLTRVLLQRARIHERRGDYEAAARDLESYLKAAPSADNAAAIRETIAKLRTGKK